MDREGFFAWILSKCSLHLLVSPMFPTLALTPTVRGNKYLDTFVIIFNIQLW